MLNRFHRRRGLTQRGATLIELLMYVGAVALILVGGVLVYQQVMASSQANDTTRQMMAMTASIKNLYANQNDFTGISNQVLVDANAVPRDMRVGDSNIIRHALGGTVEISETSDVGRYQMTFNDVNSDTCIRLATMNTGTGSQSGIDSLVIGSTDMTLPVTVSQATSACNGGSAGRVTMTWQLF